MSDDSDDICETLMSLAKRLTTTMERMTKALVLAIVYNTEGVTWDHARETAEKIMTIAKEESE